MTVNPREDGELDGGEADAARGAVNQHRFSRDGASDLEERVVGGDVGDVDGGALLEGEFVRQRINLIGIAEGFLSVGSEGEVGSAADPDAVAGFEAIDLIADGFDDAGGVGAGGVGERRF